MLKKIGKSFLALAALVVLSTVARAVWDSTTGNMPNSYQLCWGLSNNACIYGSTLTSNYVRIQTAGVDALTINGSQVVTVPGAFAVTGASTLTGNVAASGTLTVTGATALNGATTATAAQIIVSTAAGSSASLVLDGAYTTAQIQAKTPTAAGQVIWNSTLGNLCVSTGAVVEGYKLAGTASTTCQ